MKVPNINPMDGQRESNATKVIRLLRNLAAIMAIRQIAMIEIIGFGQIFRVNYMREEETIVTYSEYDGYIHYEPYWEDIEVIPIGGEHTTVYPCTDKQLKAFLEHAERIMKGIQSIGYHQGLYLLN